MGASTVTQGGAAANIVQSATIMTMNRSRPTAFNGMTGPLPNQSKAVTLARGTTKIQSDTGMPIVTAKDFMAGDGDEIVFDFLRPPKMIPIMGDNMAEGRGVGFDFVDDRFRIKQARFPINPGSRSTRKRTKHDMKKFGKAFAQQAVDNYIDQRLSTQIFSGRGTVDNIEWVIPLTDSTEYSFSEIMVNPVKAPSRNRHWVCESSGASLVKLTPAAGEINISTADIFNRDLVQTLDGLMTYLVAAPRHISVPGDKMVTQQPVTVLLVPKIAYKAFMANAAYQQLRANALTRASRAGNSPVFNQTDAYDANFLIIPVPWLHAWKAGEDVPYCASTASQTESTAKVPAAFGTTHVLSRCVVLGESAIGEAFGTFDDTQSPIFYNEKDFDHSDKMEQLAGVLGGCSKIQYLMDFNGTEEWTDNGLVTVDIAVPIPDIQAI